MVFCLVVCFGVNLFVTIFLCSVFVSRSLLPHCRFKGYNAIKYLKYLNTMHSISMHTSSCTPFLCIHHHALHFNAYIIMHSISMHTPSCTPFQCIHHHALHFYAYTIMHSIAMHTPSISKNGRCVATGI